MDTQTGHIVGKMEAMAALGSILGTFIAGFWLIQYFGTRMVLVSNAVILFILAAPYLWNGRVLIKTYLVIATLIVCSLTYWRGGFLNPCDNESQYYCIRVVDLSDEVAYGTAKGMVLDHLLHSINYRETPGVFISPYVHLMGELVKQHFESMYRTLQKQFKTVQLYLEKLPEEPERQTYVIIAGDNYQQKNMIKATMGSTRSWLNVISVILTNGTPIEKLPLLTDDFSPVDRLIGELLLKEL